MASSALPPIAGVSSGEARDDQDEQRTQKIKPLPLMLSSRAPLVQPMAVHAAQGSSVSGGPRSRPNTTPPALIHPSTPSQLTPSANEPPGSPSTGPAAFRSKFTRLRGFQGSGPLALEGSGLQQGPAAAQQGGTATGPMGQQQGSSPGLSRLHLTNWEDGHTAQMGGSSGGGAVGSWVGGMVGTQLEGLPPGYALTSQVLGGSSGGLGASGSAGAITGGGGSAGGVGGSLNAPRRGPSSMRTVSQRTRDIPALEGVSLLPSGGDTGTGSGGGALPSRPATTASSFPRYFVPFSATGAAVTGVPLGPPPGSGGGGTNGPTRHDGTNLLSPPPPSHTADPLAATFPLAASRGGGLHPPSPSSGPGVAPLDFNPPLQIPPARLHSAGVNTGGALPAWTGSYNPTGIPGLLLPPASGPDSPLPMAPSSPSHDTSSPPTLDASSTAHKALPQQPLLHPPPSAPARTHSPPSSAAQVLQRIYRTNRTPPTTADPLAISIGRHHHTLGASQPTALTANSGAAALRHSAPAARSPSPLYGAGALPPGALPPGANPGGPVSASLPGSPGPTPGLAKRSAGGAVRPRNRDNTAGTLADLSAALQKSIAAGMGEWDLRGEGGSWGHPQLQLRLLRGPLGPETLKNRYRMEERDIIALYRLLYSYSVGFFTDVENLLDLALGERGGGGGGGGTGGRTGGNRLAVAGAADLRQELLEGVLRAYAALWDEALMIVFDSELSSMLADKNAALRALDAGAVELEGLRKEKEALQAHLEEFVKQGVDNMLATRHMQQTTSKLEGEVHSLHSANDQLVTSMARHAVQVATLERQLEAARSATAAAEGRAAAAECHLADLKAIVSEQNTTLSSQFFQIKELERMCAELQETVRNLNRRRAAVLGLLSGATPEPSDPGASVAAGPSSSTLARTSRAPTLEGTLSAAVTSGPAASQAPDGGGASDAGSLPSGPPASNPNTSIGGGQDTTSTPGESQPQSASQPAAPGPPRNSHAGNGTAPPGGSTAGGSLQSLSQSLQTGQLPQQAPLSSSHEGLLADVSLLDPEELGRLLADKTRALHLMHADFLVKMHELDDQRAVNGDLREKVSAMQSAVAAAEAAAADSHATAERFKARWESGRMVVEDLEEANRRLTAKNAELVRSYWPLMTRLKEAEAEAVRCREQSAADRAQADADRAEADLLRRAAADTRADMSELAALRAEAASHELELPSDLVALLPDSHTAMLRRFSRSCHRRVAHLNAQVVALVDQVTDLRQAAVRSAKAASRAGISAGSGGLGGSSVGGSGGLGGSSGVTSIAVGTMDSAILDSAAADAAALEELRAAVSTRDKWITVLSRAMSSIVASMENLMARDWETSRMLRLEQEKRKRAAARAAKRAARAAAAAAGTEYLPSEQSVALSAPGSSLVVFSGTASAEPSSGPAGAAVETVGSGMVPGEGEHEPSSPRQRPTVTAGNSHDDSSAAAISPEVAAGSDSASKLQEAGSAGVALNVEASLSHGAVTAAPQSSGQQAVGDPNGAGGGGGEEEEGEEEDEEYLSDPALMVACGRLSQMVGVGEGLEAVSTSGQLVALDRGFERLAESAERMVEWAEALLKRKEQTATFAQVKQKLEACSRQLESASLELSTLRPTADALRHSVRGYEARQKEMAASLASYKQRADTAESRLAAAEAQLAVVGGQLREAQEAQRLLEGEYWKAKDVALEAEVTTGELKAGRMRALEAAAKALALVSGLEKEARGNYEQRVALEADLVGYKAWVRHMEATERKYRSCLGELAAAKAGSEERDRRLAELSDRMTILEQQLRFKAIEASSLESRLQALSGELVEERRTGRVALATARATSAAQLDAAIRQAGAAEAEAAAAGERVAALEGRLAEATRAMESAQAAADAATARLLPLTIAHDRLAAHLAASAPLLAAMDAAATAIGRRLDLLEVAIGDTAGLGGIFTTTAITTTATSLTTTTATSTTTTAAGSTADVLRHGSRSATGTGDVMRHGSRSATGTGDGSLMLRATGTGGTGDGNGSGLRSVVAHAPCGEVVSVVGSLDVALARLLDGIEGMLAGLERLAGEAAGDTTSAVLGALEGLVGQLLSSLSKGGTEPLQSLVVLKAQLARDDKELTALRVTLAQLQVAADEANRAAEQARSAGRASAASAAAASAAAARDGERAAEAESSLRAAQNELEMRGQQLAEARQAADVSRRQMERLQRRTGELEADLAAVRAQRRSLEAQLAAAATQGSDLRRRAEELEMAAGRDQEAAREARERLAAATAAAAAAELRCSELEAAVEAERREASRLRGEAQSALTAAAEARSAAVRLEQQALEMQSKYADMIRHDESMEEKLRAARSEAESSRKRAAEAKAEATEAEAQCEVLQQRAWQLQVALQAKHGEKEEVLRELVSATHRDAAQRVAAAAVGRASVKQRDSPVAEVEGGAGREVFVQGSCKASRTGED